MIAMILAGASLIINLIIIVKIVVHPGLQKSGYFHLHVFFLALNTIYLILTCPYRAFMAQSFLFHYMGWTAPVSYFIASNQWILKAMIDTPHCLLGLLVSICLFSFMKNIRLFLTKLIIMMCGLSMMAQKFISIISRLGYYVA